jgi:hypothetical protein
LVVAAAVVALALLAWLNRPRDEPTRATVDDAVRSFRAENDGGAERGRPGGPALGVYRYRTRGYESAQTLLAGTTTHDYDGISTIVLSKGGCGEIERWQVLAGRWTEAESCPGPHGDLFTKATEFHEFFGIEREDVFRCRGFSTSGSPVVRPGARFSSSCDSEDSSVFNAARVVGFETVSVAGKAFPAVHVESRSRLRGESTGFARREDWRRRSDGLLLRRTASSTAETDLGGGTDYSERYAIELLDLEPSR